MEESKFVKIVSDESELKWFFDNVLPPLKETEVYFLSLSARNKYLTEEEREFYSLGRTEMFAKTIIRERSWDRFIRTIRKLECDERGYTTKSNIPIPSKTMVCYININPSDTFRALNAFQGLINEYNLEIASLLVRGGDSSNFFNRLNKIDNNLMTMYQQSTGTKHYIDFDFDLENKSEKYIEEVSDFLIAKGISRYFWVDTHSGYHLLIDKNQIKFNPNDIISFGIESANKKLIGEIGEIVYNKNSMIPMPGTYQGGYPVSIINKDKGVKYD